MADKIRLHHVLIKALLIFILINAIYYVAQPLNLLYQLTVYNTLAPGRLRLPFSEYPDASFNLIMTNIDQMLASHEIAQPKGSDEYRVVLLGDSSVWGYLLEPTQTQAACLNQRSLSTASGQKVHVYNLGYPTLSAMKDLLILRHALDYQPDLVVWPTTLAALYPSDQLDFEVIHAQYQEVAALQSQYHFNLYQWPLPAPSWFDQTLIGQRRALADWMRYQLYGLGWAATAVDHRIPKFVTPHPIELTQDDNILSVNVMRLKTAGQIVPEDLSLDIMKAGIDIAASHNVPVLLINEPMYRSETSPNRWNTYYPKWAYDSYRKAIQGAAAQFGWHYVDLWDAVPTDQFTDTDFHLTPTASCNYAEQLSKLLLRLAISSR